MTERRRHPAALMLMLAVAFLLTQSGTSVRMNSPERSDRTAVNALDPAATPPAAPPPGLSPWGVPAAGPTLAPGEPSTPRSTPAGSSPRIVRPADPLNVRTLAEEALGQGQDAYLGDTSRYAYVALNDYEFGRVPAIHAAQPMTKVIAYAETQTEGSSSCTDDRHPSWGVSFCYANQYHPEWFLLTASGQRARYHDNGFYMMDMGSSSYQHAWVHNEIATVKRDGFDGVLMDDVNLSPGHGVSGTLAKYTDSQYRAAVQAFVATVGPTLKAAGLIVSANVGASNPWDGAALAESERLARSLSIYNHEFWMRYQAGTGLFTADAWLTSIRMQEGIEATGTAWTAVMYGDALDTAAMRYARASFLLAWNGSAASALTYRPDPDLVDPFNENWATSLGTPTGPRYQQGIGWTRQFTHGQVVVNPSAGRSQTFTLGSAHRTPDGSVVTSVTLGPGSGLVLPIA
ncbi:MAG: hypothetical protein JF887_01295 [Candidatus Dormibacteraeota bacterium]|uniref:Uncharacterized protein n=1 Tax=Candidatus Amunia macphersoniae TaxID=3127014 RepID=A0A934KCY9_9BACT|nr:hypothetical protein [Candidatus Dormibacteraeota bacterium]